jgi:linoleoyl-CoA desaturase
MNDAGFRQLRANIRQHGYYERPTARMLLDLSIHILVAATGLGVYLLASGWIVRICGLIVYTAGSIGIGTNTHTSSHHATSKKRWLNELLTYAGYPLYFGLSATYWRHKHLLVHHSAPNVMGVDGDADLSPWFATTMDEVRQSSGIRRFYYRHLQRFVFPAAISMTLFSQQIAGCVFLARSIRSRERQATHLFDFAALLAHVVLTVGLPMFFFEPSRVLAFYFVRNVLLAYAMFAVFAPAHFLSEAARLDKDVAPSGDLLAVTAATLNFQIGRLGKLMCAGLEYQIEHHLLPDISYVHYPAVSVLVEEFCRSRALPYRRYPLRVALWRSLSAVRNPCEVVHDASVLVRNNPLIPARAGQNIGSEKLDISHLRK